MAAGTMGRLSVGVTGLKTNQYALNTTAHNLTNVHTEGYSRQQVLLTDRTYNNLSVDAIRKNQTGLGVVTAEVKTVRDNFADISYRTESGRNSYYKAQTETVKEVEGFFSELEGATFNDSLNELWKSLQEMQKDSNNIVTRSSFIATSLTYLDRVQSIRDSLITYQRNINTQIKNEVKTINDLGKEILDLNQKILSAEASGIENANDYRDLRNKAYDKLSSLVSTDIVPNADGTAEIYLEGRIFVTKGKLYELDTQKICDNEYYAEAQNADGTKKYKFANDATDFLMPVWKDDTAPLFHIEKIPTAENNTDVGALKGLMMSRGYFTGDYTDVPEKPAKPLETDYDNVTDYQNAMNQYNTDIKEYADKLEYFNKYVEPYTITNLMSQFDVLVNAMVSGINDALCPNVTLADGRHVLNEMITLADGTQKYVSDILDVQETKEEIENNNLKAGIGMGTGNEYAGEELFKRKSVDRYTEVEMTLPDGSTAKLKVYNEENPDDYYTLYSSGNLEINDNLLQDPSKIPLTRETGAEAQEVVDKMLSLWNTKFATVSPNSLVECTYVDFYAGMTDALADRGYTYDNMAKTCDQSATELDNLRQMVVGVSSDEELSHLIRFQHAFNASSRYINTVSEMIEHLINTLGS